MVRKSEDQRTRSNGAKMIGIGDGVTCPFCNAAGDLLVPRFRFVRVLAGNEYHAIIHRHMLVIDCRLCTHQFFWNEGDTRHARN